MDYARSFAHSDSLMDFIKKPTVVLRAATTFIMMLIFSCVLDKGYSSKGVCYYNGKQGACNYTVGISVIAFFMGIGLLAVTFFWDQISNSIVRKYIVFADMSFCGLWTFLFFVDFCFITDMWRKTPAKLIMATMVKSNLQFTIVCALVSVFLLALQAYLAYKQLNDMQNDASGIGGYSDPAADITGGYGGSPFPPHTESAGGNYQSPYAS